MLAPISNLNNWLIRVSKAARRGFKFGWIHAIAREQAPVNLYDLVNQRRRWYSGIMSIQNWGVRLMLTSSMLGSLASASLSFWTSADGPGTK
ncbi:uncharacterized protein N7484_007887 [Penicillium longicatenatum]|uniref:uncharacterized protein n=1 Tax=Penicillium longicatenatum TaxID=1561947 RepID=UPI002548E0AB|nr:uncharacterized protein N7484_007887 [Penicillium longicatenatum]KAJ5640025.1 hypothetical protein N7484_007887 [Penicillium longicatenatum]